MSGPAPTTRISWKSDQNCNLYRNFFIYIFLIRNLQNEKRDHPHFPHSPPSEVEGARIVLISFRNIAKKILKYTVFFLFFSNLPLLKISCPTQVPMLILPMSKSDSDHSWTVLPDENSENPHIFKKKKIRTLQYGYQMQGIFKQNAKMKFISTIGDSLFHFYP